MTDDVYVGYIPNAPMMEISAVDPQLGGVFYSLEQSKGDKPVFKRTFRRSLHTDGGGELIAGTETSEGYSEAFDRLPAPMREQILQRLYAILTGEDQDPQFARLNAGDREAVLEILRETKPNLPDYWRETAGGR